MKTLVKNLLRTLLIALAAAGFGVWAWGKVSGGGSAESGQIAAAADPADTEGVVVTYFTTDVRCESCREIETLTRRTVEERFADDFAAGSIRFVITNIDRPENAHFAEDYGIAFKTVVIAGRAADCGEEVGGAPGGESADWRMMDDVWLHFNDPDKFIDYLASEIEPRLGTSS